MTLTLITIYLWLPSSDSGSDDYRPIKIIIIADNKITIYVLIQLWLLDLNSGSLAQVILVNSKVLVWVFFLNFHFLKFAKKGLKVITGSTGLWCDFRMKWNGHSIRSLIRLVMSLNNIWLFNLGRKSRLTLYFVSMIQIFPILKCKRMFWCECEFWIPEEISLLRGRQEVPLSPTPPSHMNGSVEKTMTGSEQTREPNSLPLSRQSMGNWKTRERKGNGRI